MKLFTSLFFLGLSTLFAVGQGSNPGGNGDASHGNPNFHGAFSIDIGGTDKRDFAVAPGKLPISFIIRRVGAGESDTTKFVLDYSPSSIRAKYEGSTGGGGSGGGGTPPAGVSGGSVESAQNLYGEYIAIAVVFPGSVPDVPTGPFSYSLSIGGRSYFISNGTAQYSANYQGTGQAATRIYGYAMAVENGKPANGPGWESSDVPPVGSAVTFSQGGASGGGGGSGSNSGAMSFGHVFPGTLEVGGVSASFNGYANFYAGGKNFSTRHAVNDVAFDFTLLSSTGAEILSSTGVSIPHSFSAPKDAFTGVVKAHVSWVETIYEQGTNTYGISGQSSQGNFYATYSAPGFSDTSGAAPFSVNISQYVHTFRVPVPVSPVGDTEEDATSMLPKYRSAPRPEIGFHTLTPTQPGGTDIPVQTIGIGSVSLGSGLTMDLEPTSILMSFISPLSAVRSLGLTILILLSNWWRVKFTFAVLDRASRVTVPGSATTISATLLGTGFLSGWPALLAYFIPVALAMVVFWAVLTGQSAQMDFSGLWGSLTGGDGSLQYFISMVNIFFPIAEIPAVLAQNVAWFVGAMGAYFIFAWVQKVMVR